MDRTQSNKSLFEAAKRGERARVQELLQTNSTSHIFSQEVNIHAEKDLALCMAAKFGHAEIVRDLLQAGADVHAKEELALRLAVELGQTTTVLILLEVGADMHVFKDKTILLAAEKGHVETLKVLLQANFARGLTQRDIESYNKALSLAVEKGRAETVQVLLQAGADVHVRDEEVLIRAVQKGHVETVQILLQAGANVHARNDKAIHLAVMNSHEEIVKILLQAGADVKTYNTATLKNAISENNIEKVKILLREEKDFHSINIYYLYHYILPNDRTEMLKLLLRAGSIIDKFAMKLFMRDELFSINRKIYKHRVQDFLRAGAKLEDIDIPFTQLKDCLTPSFILSLSEDTLAEIETFHAEFLNYKWGENRKILKTLDENNTFDAKISFADLYYRPGELGYFRAISD